MPVTGMNHAVLYVRDADATAAFYVEVLGFTRLQAIEGLRGAVFLRAPGSTNDHDLGLFTVGPGAGASTAGRSTVGLYHIAWEVDTLEELERLRGALAARRALTGASDHGTTKALYARDPDGLEFEVSWLVPAALIDDEVRAAQATIAPLDLAAEKARYGATTRGGTGVSVPS
ncbi:MAG: VOC family protein [Acidimicrobiales bacterium]